MKKLLSISFILFFIDQLIKIVIDFSLQLNHSIKIIPNFFYITYVRNIGAAFSILEGNRIFLILLALLALSFIYQNLLKNKNLNHLEIFTYSLLIGGIFANLYDRIFRGYVIDYFDFQLGNYSFPIFNLADICIVIGCFFFIFIILKEDFHENKSRTKR